MLGGDPDLSMIIICRESIGVLPTGNLKADLSLVIVGELSAELETIQDIRSSVSHTLNVLPRLCYHFIVVDVLRCVCLCALVNSTGTTINSSSV